MPADRIDSRVVASPTAPLQFWLLAAFIVLVFLTGGASRSDAASLMLLRPVSVLLCAAALITMSPEHWRGRAALAWLIGLVIGLAALHLVPLPPAIWQSMPGRQNFAAVDQLAGLGDIWRPLTLTPMNGWHALSALSAPLAVILLGVQLGRQHLLRLLPLLIALGAVSGLMGLMQIIGEARGPLYLYRYTNEGSAVGLFANRNHAACLLALMLPMLAVYASLADGDTDKQNGKRLFAMAVAAVVLPLVLVTGSRAGAILAFVGALLAAALYQRPVAGRVVRKSGKRTNFRAMPLYVAAILVALIVFVVISSRSESINRLVEVDVSEDLRFEFWKVSADLVSAYFPIGSGAGSFVEVYQIAEPSAMLSRFYTNHAHNDWLETFVTFGVPGLAVMLTAALLLVRQSWRVWRANGHVGSTIRMARLASVMLAMLAAASFVDYPLRTSTLISVAAVCLLWLFGTTTGGQPVPPSEKGAA